MNVVAIWNNDLGKSLISSANLHSDIDNLLDAIECANKDCAPTYHDNNIYFEQIGDISFSEWLYNGKYAPECSDAKRELIKYLNKSTTIEASEYDDYLKEVENPNNNSILTICFSFAPKNIRFVCSSAHYWEAKQGFLSKNVKRICLSKRQ